MLVLVVDEIADEAAKWVMSRRVTVGDSMASPAATTRTLDLSGVAAPTATALGLWILVPLAAGTVRTLRQEIT